MKNKDVIDTLVRIKNEKYNDIPKDLIEKIISIEAESAIISASSEKQKSVKECVDNSISILHSSKE